METEKNITGFREIPLQEQQELNGGIWPLLAGIAIAAVAETIRDWDNFKNGLMGRPEEKSKYFLNVMPS
jgi:hypothetical protein